MKDMTRKDAIHSLRKVLVRRRDALRSALAGDWSMLQELHTQSKGDVVDFAVDAVQDEISSQLAEVESRELAYIEVALERMQAGGYGVCEHCNQSIPLARLQALPYATLCIRCQREAEKTGGSRSTPDWGRLIDAGGVDNDVVFSDIELDVP
jgi:DnaK suppressor protein